MEEDTLRRIGLTDGEVRAYLALLHLGQSPVGPVVREARVSSSKIYELLDKLVQKGLVTSIQEGGKRQFRTTSPRKIFDLLAARKKEIGRQEEEIEKILPALLKREKERARPHEAQVYEGYQGVKTYFSQMLTEMKKGEERLVFGARSGYPVAKPAQRFFQQYHRRWVGAGLRTRMIFNDDLKGNASTTFFEDMPLTEVRYLPQQTLSSIGIQKDTVDILIWTKETTIVFVIKSREAAGAFRAYFEMLWGVAKK